MILEVMNLADCFNIQVHASASLLLVEDKIIYGRYFS